MPLIRLRKYKFIQFHLHLHYNIFNACEYIICVRCLYWVNNNQQATGDQHFGVIFGLTFFLTSHSKPDYICNFKPLYITAIYLPISKIIASNFQGMLLRDSTMQRQHNLYFSNITMSYPGPYFVGSQKNRLNETVLLSTKNIDFHWWARK